MVVVAHCASAHDSGARRPSANAILPVHVQDEADIRLRSGDARDWPSLPKRGWASEGQAHVVTLVAGRSRRENPAEFEALGDKLAAN